MDNMEENVMLLVSVFILLLGVPLGRVLRRFAGKEEIDIGQKYFKAIIIITILGTIVSLVFQKTYLVFTFVFILILTKESIKNKKMFF